ncbi:MAG TPA: helix-turn-helix domain-containing protein [Micromonosporaceae bacterium]
MGETGGAGSGPGGGAGTNPKKESASAEVMHTVKELAGIWRCSVAHIYNLINTRRLRSTDIGVGRAKTRIPASAAADYIRRNSRTVTR